MWNMCLGEIKTSECAHWFLCVFKYAWPTTTPVIWTVWQMDVFWGGAHSETTLPNSLCRRVEAKTDKCWARMWKKLLDYFGASWSMDPLLITSLRQIWFSKYFLVRTSTCLFKPPANGSSSSIVRISQSLPLFLKGGIGWRTAVSLCCVYC